MSVPEDFSRQVRALEAADILIDLTLYEGLPKKALRAATVQRGEMAPLFLEEVKAFVAGDEDTRLVPTPLLLVFHLFGEWRETSAYRPLARLLRCPPDALEELLGDCITETAHRVMAAVFDGDPQPLYDIILDPEAEEFVRSRMSETLAMLVHEGRLPRAEAERFLRDCFMNLLPQAECYVWQGWQSAIALLGLTELKGLVKKAFDRGFIHPHWLSFRHFEQSLAQGVAHPSEPRFPGDKEFTLFGNVIDELSTWHGFSEAYQQEQEQQRLWGELDPDPFCTEPARNPFRQVGRNDPCPCGSGKKFKRCCLQ